MTKVIEVASLLIDIEAELRRLNLWQSEPPSPAALASVEPFAIDTLNFPQWLQFIFLVKIHALIERQQPLPERCNMAPMAEEYFRGGGLDVAALLDTLVALDQLLSSQ